MPVDLAGQLFAVAQPTIHGFGQPFTNRQTLGGARQLELAMRSFGHVHCHTFAGLAHRVVLVSLWMHNNRKMQKSQMQNAKIFAQRLKEARTALGLTLSDLAAKLETSPGTVGTWETGRNFAKRETMQKLADALGVQLDWLEGRTDSQQTSPPSTPPNASAPFELPPRRKVPLVSWVRAGRGHNYEDMCNGLEEWAESDSKDPNAFALTIEGDSMEPEVKAGDVAICEPNSEPRTGRLVVAKLRDTGEHFIKRFYRKGPEGQLVRLESTNPAYPPIERPRTDFEWIYRVCKTERRDP